MTLVLPSVLFPDPAKAAAFQSVFDCMSSDIVWHCSADAALAEIRCSQKLQEDTLAPSCGFLISFYTVIKAA